VLCGCNVGCEVLREYGVGSGEREDKQCRRRRALIVQIGGVLPRWLWPEDLNWFPAKPGKFSKKESRKKPKPTRTINSQKGANPQFSNLRNNT